MHMPGHQAKTGYILVFATYSFFLMHNHLAFKKGQAFISFIQLEYSAYI